MARLLLTFINGSGGKVTITVPDTREDLTSAEVTGAMEAIVAGGLIKPNGSSLVAPFSAKITDSSTKVIFQA